MTGFQSKKRNIFQPQYSRADRCGNCSCVPIILLTPLACTDLEVGRVKAVGAESVEEEEVCEIADVRPSFRSFGFPRVKK